MMKAAARREIDMVAAFAVDRRVDALTDEMARKVSHHEFNPVRIVAFGLVGLILTGVVGALLKTVLMG